MPTKPRACAHEFLGLAHEPKAQKFVGIGPEICGHNPGGPKIRGHWPTIRKMGLAHEETGLCPQKNGPMPTNTIEVYNYNHGRRGLGFRV